MPVYQLLFPIRNCKFGDIIMLFAVSKISLYPIKVVGFNFLFEILPGISIACSLI